MTSGPSPVQAGLAQLRSEQAGLGAGGRRPVVGSGQEVAKQVGKAELRAHTKFGGTCLPLRSCVSSLKLGWSWGFCPESMGRAREMALGTCCLSQRSLHGEQSAADHSQSL